MRRSSKLMYIHAALIAFFVLGLFYYWFALANRYIIFLYNHLGSTPFDERTRSRYWMAGLVAAGVVMVGEIALNWLLGRVMGIFYRHYAPPPWQQLWLATALPVAGGILLITMRCNQPTLPIMLAGACVLATLSGLALAFAAGGMAAHQMPELIWRSGFGVGFAPILLLLRSVELPQRGLIAPERAYLLAAGSLLASMVMVGGLAIIRCWRELPPLTALRLLATGGGVTYLLLPLAHHLFFVPPEYRYISTADNFFAFNPTVQITVFAVAGLLAWGVEQLQRTMCQSSLWGSHHESA